MKQLLILLLLCNSFLNIKAQHTSNLKGALKDTSDFKSVAYANILAINTSDSVLLKYTHASDKGVFELKGLPPIKIRLLITRPGFADYEDFVTLSEGQTTDIGLVNMLSKSTLLKEVIIKDRIDAIRIKGDTTEFLVDSFLTNKNANVEDLMKRLPGIQVDKDGKITAQGKEVKKVLVDGEEFFGDDPTIATKNLKATQVESVQVFDKKSDQATISGIDDGIKEKTINLKLKEDAKKGYFGKASGGLGTDSRYEHDAMINRFNKKQKISAYGAMSNTNKTGLNWEDQQKFGGSDGFDYYNDDDGNSYMTYNNGDDGFYGVGIPQTWYVGAHYSDKKKNDKHAYSFNASHKEMTVRGFDDNFTQYILPDTFYFNRERNDMSNFRKGNTFSTSYNLALDSFTTLKIKLNASQSEYNRLNVYQSENRNALRSLVNSNRRTQSTDGQREELNSSINLIKKFKLAGRSLSVGFTQRYSSVDDDGFLSSDIRFYSNDSTFTSTLIDQKKLNTGVTENYSGNITYTEPFGKKFFVITDYAINFNQDKNKLTTLAKSGGSDYNLFVDTLSNDFFYKNVVNRGGLSLKYQYKKITSSIGGRISQTDLSQNNRITDSARTQLFINYFPAARFNYKIGTSSSFELSYNGRTRQPSLSQIQPLINNNNPLDIYVGNTGLVQSFSNSYEARYNSYKPLKGSGIWSSLRYSNTYNDFAQKSTVTAEGKRTYQTVNVDGNYSLYGSFYHYFNTKKHGFFFNNNVSFSQSQNVNIINDLNNINTNNSVGLGSRIGKEKEDVYYISLEADWDYTRSETSVRPDVVTDYWISEYDFYAEFYLPKKFVFEFNASHTRRQATSSFDKPINNTIINLELKKKFTEKENWHVSVSVRDLLNENVGFRRSATSNFINENVHTVLRRYFMLTVTYNFSSANKNENKK